MPRRGGEMGVYSECLPSRRNKGVPIVSFRVACVDDVYRHGCGKDVGRGLGDLLEDCRHLRLLARQTRIRLHGRIYHGGYAYAAGRWPCGFGEDYRRMRFETVPSPVQIVRAGHQGGLRRLCRLSAATLCYGRVHAAQTYGLPYEATMTRTCRQPVNTRLIIEKSDEALENYFVNNSLSIIGKLKNHFNKE